MKELSKRKNDHNILNVKQRRVLDLLYRFRFITALLLSQYKGTSLSTVKASLALLEKQSYIAKRYDKTYKLAGKGAEYYLAPQGLKELRSSQDTDEDILHSMYKNSHLSSAFIERCLQSVQTYIKLDKDYPERFNIYTRVEMTHVDGFIDPTPDLYLESTKENKLNYFLELQAGNQLFVLRKRVAAIVDHYDSGEWERGDYPDTLVVCDSPQAEKAIQEYLAQLLESTGVDDEIRFLTTSQKALQNYEKNIWTNPLAHEKMVSL